MRRSLFKQFALLALLLALLGIGNGLATGTIVAQYLPYSGVALQSVEVLRENFQRTTRLAGQVQAHPGDPAWIAELEAGDQATQASLAALGSVPIMSRSGSVPPALTVLQDEYARYRTTLQPLRATTTAAPPTLGTELAAGEATINGQVNALERLYAQQIASANRLNTAVLSVLTLLLLGTTIAALAWLWGLLKRVEQVRQGAMALTGGHFDTQLTLPGGDELSQIATAFNGMATRLGGRVSELEQTTAAFRRERDLLQGLLDSSPDTIYFKDTKSRFTRINRAQARVLGVAQPEDAVGMSDADFFADPALAQGFYEEEQLLLATGEAIIDQAEYNPTADGKPRWFSVTKVPLKDEQGQSVGLVGISRDITERMVATEALGESEARFRSLVQTLPIGVLLAGPQEEVLLSNPAAQTLLGLTEAQLRGEDPYQPDWHVTHEDGSPFLREEQPIPQALQSGQFQRDVVMGIYRPTTQDHVWLLVNADPQMDEHGNVRQILCSLSDITAHRQVEAERRYAKQLRVAAEISEQVSTILEPQRLLQATAALLQERFDLYHVHLYGLDEATSQLIVQAGTGEAGRQLREEGHSIPLDHPQSIVAQAARTQGLVAIQDVQASSFFLPNSLLPDTRSEVAVPLVVGGRLLGVFDVQDDEVNRFNEADLDVLSTLSGQIAVALENARLFTEAERAAAEIRAQSAFLRQVLDINPNFIFAKDRAGHFTLVNQAVAQAYGTTLEDMVGKTDADFNPNAEEVEFFHQKDLAVINTRQELFIPEERITTASGEVRWFQTIKHPLVGLDGSVEQVLGIATDITLRKQAEEEAQDQRTFLRQVIDISPNLIFVKDREGRYTLVNQTVADVYGTTVEELLGKTDADFNPNADEVEQYLREDLIVIDTLQERFIPEEPITDAAGNLRWLQTIKRPLIGPDGTTTQVLGVATDVTARKAAEAERQQRTQLVQRQNEALLRLSHNEALAQGDLDGVLASIIQETAQTLEIERVSVWFYNEAHDALHCALLYERTGRSFSSGITLTATDFPPYFAAMRQQRLIVADDALQHPATSIFTEPYFKPLDIHSLLDAPIQWQGQTVGVLCHEQVGEIHHWTLEEQLFAGSMADLVARGLETRQRRQAEAALRMSQSQLARAQEIARLGSWEWDIPSQAITWSDELCRLSGLEPGTFAGTVEAFYATIHPDDRAFVQATGVQAYSTGTPFEYRTLWPDGTVRVLLAQGQLFSDEQGQPRLMRGTAQDITARKAAELALRESEERYRSLFEQSPMGIFGVGPDLTLTHFNDRFVEILRSTHEQLHGLNLTRLRDSRVLPPIQQALAGEIARYEGPYQATTSPAEIWITLEMASLRDDAGQVIGAIGMVEDRTDQRQAEAERERLSTILEATSDFVGIADAQGKLLYINQAGRQMLDLPQAFDVTTTMIPDQLAPEVRETVRAEALPIAIEEGLWRGETILQHAAGPRTPASVVMMAHKAPDGTLEYISAIARDVSERQQVEVERERFTNQLRTAADLANQINTIRDLDLLLSETVAQLQSRFSLYHVHVYLLDSEQAQLVMHTGSGEVGRTLRERDHAIPLAQEQSLVARAARTQRVVVVHDIASEPGFLPNPLLPDTRSEAAVPLVVGERVVGVLDVQDNAAHRFAPGDLDVLRTLAGQIATALENAQLFEQVQQALAETQLRLAISQALTSAQGEAAVIQTILEQARVASNLDTALLLFDPTGTEPTYVLHHLDETASVPSGLRFPVSVYSLGQYLDDAPLFVTNDVMTDERLGEQIRAISQAQGSRSFALLKLQVGDEAVGLLSVSSAEPDVFTEERLRPYQIIVERGALSLRAARLGEQVQESLEQTAIRFAISQQLARARTEEEVMDAIIEAAGFYPEASVTYVAYQLEEGTPTFVTRRSRAFHPALQAMEVGMTFTEAVFPTLRYILAGQSFIASHALTDERVDAGARGLLGFLGGAGFAVFPLWAAEGLVGEITVIAREAGFFDDPRVRYLYESLAEQASVALRAARLFDETQRTAERLREVDRLKSEFLANMSHELRTPLNSIIGYAEIMLMGLNGPLNEETSEDVQAIHSSGHHLLRLINDILDLAKIEAGRMVLDFEQVPIETLLDEVRVSHQPLLQKKLVTLTVEIEEGLPRIWADRLRLNQVLTNLVSNAVKFTEAGTIHIHAGREDGQIAVSIRDTGIGIDQRHVPTIFEEFRQVDGSSTRRAQGSGLGLAISRHLVQMHGGTIDVQSELGKGSTFTVLLPLYTPVPADEAAPSPEGSANGARSS